MFFQHVGPAKANRLTYFYVRQTAILHPLIDRANGTTEAQIVLTNHSNHIAFFVRTEVTVYPGGNEILPIRYRVAQTGDP